MKAGQSNPDSQHLHEMDKKPLQGPGDTRTGGRLLSSSHRGDASSHTGGQSARPHRGVSVLMNKTARL